MMNTSRTLSTVTGRNFREEKKTQNYYAEYSKSSVYFSKKNTKEKEKFWPTTKLKCLKVQFLLKMKREIKMSPKLSCNNVVTLCEFTKNKGLQGFCMDFLSRK